MGKEVDNTFTWVIKNFSSSLQAEEIYSEHIVIGGCKWRLIAYPEVNNVETQQWFDKKTPGWDFPPMITLKELSEKDCGFVVNDEVMIVATVDVLEVISAIDASEKSKSIDVKGFQVLPSQVKSVNRLFKRHPDIASKLSIKNQSLKTAYMNVLLSLTETLHKSFTEISKDDLSDAETTLLYMKNIGFKLDWLKNKFDELLEKMEKEADEIQMQKVIEQEFTDLSRTA